MRQAMPSASCVVTGADHAAGAERVEVGGGMRRHHAHQLAAGAGVARAAAAAQKPEPWPMGTYTTSGSAPGEAFEELDPVGRHAAHQLAMERRHHVQALLAPASAASRVRARPGSRRRARPVGRPARASRRSSRPSCRAARRWWPQAVQPRAKPTDWPWLPRVALMTPRSAGLLARQRLEVRQAAAHLEGAGRRVVLVLDPHRAAQALAQQRPGVLRRRRQVGVDRALRGLDFFALKFISAPSRPGARPARRARFPSGNAAPAASRGCAPGRRRCAPRPRISKALTPR
jgi:hypothetical protein